MFGGSLSAPGGNAFGSSSSANPAGGLFGAKTAATGGAFSSANAFGSSSAQLTTKDKELPKTSLFGNAPAD